MKQLTLIFGFFFLFLTQVIAQKSLSEYAYVLVPQQFEFQRGVDQYQVNTLVRHLFREAGFNPIYEIELRGLPRCEGLYADLIFDSSFISTTFKVALKDCNNNVIFISEPGTSKEKEYKKGYHEAIRRAFRSIDILGVRQGDLEAFRQSIEKRDAALLIPETIEVKPVAQAEIQVDTESMSAYNYNGETYFLETTNEGFVLYQNKGDAFQNFGTLSKTTRDGMYLFNSKGKSMLASFDTNNNLIIDTEDSEGKPFQSIFTKVKEE